MDLITLLLTAVLIFIPASYFFKFFSRRFKFIRLINKLPGPPALPLLGNALDNAVPRNQLMKTWMARSLKYAPIYRSWGGPLAVLHLTRPEHIELILNSSKHIDKSMVYNFLHPWLGTGLLTSTGAKWHSHRKMITPTFHFKILDTFVDVFVEKSQILVDKLADKLNKEEFDFYPFITRCAMDIICETAMGIEINAQRDSKSDYVRAVYEVSELTILRSLRPWLWHPIVFNWTKYGRRYNKSLSVLHGFTNKVIRERKQLLEEKKQNNSDETTQRNEDDDLGKKKRMAFLDLLLEASAHASTPLTDVEIREEVDTFMFEGHDTTTAGICWSLFLLGSHPEYQDKVAAELDTIFADDPERKITMRDLNEMKYLERVIKESLRLFPSVPFIGRCLSEDTKFGEYLVPAGTYVNVEIFHVHRCPDQFPDPNSFNPDNFLPENVQKRHPYAYVPFSAGPRNCIGQKFAVLEEKTMLASVLRKYTVTSMEKLENLNLMNELILRPESGIQLKLTPRLRTVD
uniref:Cytochrome P450 4C1 n=1 Tax=Cacopsylla melanoneura TaxID=428564 RepID=A0A8D8XRZ0_9HEMI